MEFKEREEAKGDRERNINVRGNQGLVASCMCPDSYQICNLGMCYDQGSNSQLFELETILQTNELHQPGSESLGVFLMSMNYISISL